MKSRPIRVLVNALRDLGANIEYKNKDGYPPLKIMGKKILKNEVSLPADISSQYVSSLMMLGLIIENGIKLKLEGIITSKPYILMTKELIQKIGYNVTVDQNYIQVSDINKSSEKTIIVESDWSSASYFYSIAAFSHDAEITLKSFNRDSIQGDSIVSKIYKKLGVDTIYMKDYIII